MEGTGGEDKNLNYLQKILEDKGLSSRVLGLCLNIHKGTLTNWTNNLTQPNLDDIEKMAEFLELGNHKLIRNTKRIDTGLIAAVVEEYKRLTKDQGMDLYVNTLSNNSKTKKVYNPKLQSALWEFISVHKKHHIEKPIRSKSIFIDKYYRDIDAEKHKGKAIFICKALPQEGKPYFEYLVVNESLGIDHFVARFARKEDAEAYVKWLISRNREGKEE